LKRGTLLTGLGPSGSHPSRVRGLKQGIPENRNAWHASHPSRVRGLKQNILSCTFSRCWSHPSRVRGLKPNIILPVAKFRNVAPFTGAWIETPCSCNWGQKLLVAPFTGAWIETPMYNLKPLPMNVAPFTGAWIETGACNQICSRCGMSHPSRVRGLKLSAWRNEGTKLRSHPSRVRGLKRKSLPEHIAGRKSRTLHGCVD